MSIIDTLITNRTQAGHYDITDLNRVGEAISDFRGVIQIHIDAGFVAADRLINDSACALLVDVRGGVPICSRKGRTIKQDFMAGLSG